MMSRIDVDVVTERPASQRHMEFVERKGLGHPDTMCDQIMEAISVALCREYLEAAGYVLHHNIDKGLLVAGQTRPTLGGGTVETPMRLIIGDRATDTVGNRRLPVGEIAEAAARDWIRRHMRYVDPGNHVVLQNELRPGSAELTDIFARGQITANDTSAAVGYAPLTETEQLVLALEHYINSPVFQQEFPEAGEDVKVMAVRRDGQVSVTVAIAFIDACVTSSSQYFERKAMMCDALRQFVLPQLRSLELAELTINALDDPSRGTGGMYLTVLGTSAEGADGGQVGRGNRVNGLISLNRPMSTEAAAGKNPVSHVGKIYNVFCHHAAHQIHQAVPGIEDISIWMCSQIGQPISEPWGCSVQLHLEPGVKRVDVEEAIQRELDRQLKSMPQLLEDLIHGRHSIC